MNARKPSQDIGLILLAVFVAWPGTAAAQAKSLQLKLSDGSKMSTFIYKPKGAGSYPAVIILPVRRGMNSYSKSWASRLASKGYVALVVNYRTGGGWPDVKVGEAYDYLKELPEVDEKRIGLADFSFGGQRELEIVSDWSYAYPPRPIGAMIAYYLGNNLPHPNDSVPPILFLHGDRDNTTEWKEVVEFCKKTHEANRICEYKIYKNTYHSFTHKSKTGRVNSAAEQDAFSRSVEFLNKYLRDAETD